MASCNECPLKTHEQNGIGSISPGDRVLNYKNFNWRVDGSDDLHTGLFEVCKERIGSMACGYALGRVEQSAHDNAWSINYPKDDSDSRMYSHGGNYDDNRYIDEIHQFRLDIEQEIE